MLESALVVHDDAEALIVPSATLIEMGGELAWEGFDVDVIPYGQPVTSDDLAGVDPVVVVPVIDYAKHWRRISVSYIKRALCPPQARRPRGNIHWWPAKGA